MMMKIAHKPINNHSPHFLSHRQSKGAGLIEVLIAALVLSVGILGYVGLQINAKRLNFESTQRTTATYLAQNLLERMRSNPQQLNAYVVSDLDPGSLGEPNPNCTTAQCTTAELATFDLWEWDQLLDGASVSGGLINPMACVTNNGNYLTVVIVWQGKTELDQSNAPACGAENYVDTLELRQWIQLNTFVADV